MSRTKLSSLRNRRFDLAVVGGGINGAAIAQMAAAQGWSVFLAEREDFGSGTTSRSTRLIHGGLRYLEHGELRLVFESLREREALLRLAPHQVRPLQFLLPVYRGYRHRSATIAAGLTLYDLLSLGSSLPRHRRLSARMVHRLEPALAREGLLGGFLYADCQVLFPERICLEYALAAGRAGAEVRNHCAAIGIDVFEGRARGLRLRDMLSGEEAVLEARAIVNAAGPWVDGVLRESGRRMTRYIGGTRGSHIMVDFHGHGPRQAIYSEAQDGRPFFMVPWQTWHLVGTTDLRFDGDPSGVLPTDGEIEYLEDEVRRRLPRLSFANGDLCYAFAGVRPLPYTPSGAEGAISRRHVIQNHSSEGVAGLYSILGGKLSTFRTLAKQAVQRVGRTEGFKCSDARTGAQPFAGGSVPADPLACFGPATRAHLDMLYGPRAGEVAELACQTPGFAEKLSPSGPDLVAEAIYAVQHERAATVGDVLLRRIGAGWNRRLGLDCAEQVAGVILRARGEDTGRTMQLVDAYRHELALTFRAAALMDVYAGTHS